MGPYTRGHNSWRGIPHSFFGITPKKMNFDHDYNAPQEMGIMLLVQATNWIASEINPILGTVSICGSIFYIFMKIRREFFNKNKD